MTLDSFDTAITISGHSLSMSLIILPHARQPVEVEVVE
jgi:hypothetical protein